MNEKIGVIILSVLVITIFIFEWKFIPRKIKNVKQSGKIISNECKYINSLKKSIIVRIILLVLIIILSQLMNLSGYKYSWIVLVYYVIGDIVSYKINKKYIVKNYDVK